MNQLPAEIVLQICSLLLPDEAYEPSQKTDLRNLRLTCRALLPHANDVFFQHYDMLLWLKEDGTFAESCSFRLLMGNESALAKLVRSVRLSVADWPTIWLKRQVAFGSANNSESDTCVYAYRVIQRYIHGTAHANRIADIDLEKLNMVYEMSNHDLDVFRLYHRAYVEQFPFSNQYRRPEKAHLRGEASRRLRLLPAVRQLELSQAMFDRTPVFAELCRFWREHGFEPYERDLASFGKGFSEGDLASFGRGFSWFDLPSHIEILGACLAAIPQSVTAIRVDVPRFQSGSNDEAMIQDISATRGGQRNHIRSISLTVGPYDTTVRSGYWINLISNFESLTVLSLNNHWGPFDGCQARSGPAQLRGIEFDRVRLPTLHRLALMKWTLDQKCVASLHVICPRLKYLYLEDIAMGPIPADEPDQNSWLHTAEAISRIYNGSLALEFGPGSVTELEGRLAFHSIFWHPLVDPFPVRDIVLKQPALDILVSVACAKVSVEEVYELYKTLASHEPPDLYIAYLDDPEGPDFYSAAIRRVETAGMTFLYYPAYDNSFQE